MANKVWSITYTSYGKAHIVSGLSKAEAKKAWKDIMIDYGTNTNMSAHCREAYLERNDKIICQKNGDYWFLNDKMIACNAIWSREEIDMAIAAI
jgi:hypothetical protein